MKKSVVVVAAALAALVGGVSIAGAAGETATVNYGVKGKFSPKSYKNGQLTFGLNIATTQATILPMKLAKLTFPPKAKMTFVPRKGLPVCKASQTALSAAPAQAEQACGKSRVGNGDATFQLGQSASQGAFRVGSVLIYYGGMVGKNVKLRFSAWSDDTRAGVYAEGILKPNGKMDIAMPRLTADSAVTSLNMAIPGRAKTINWASGGTTALAAGVDRGFVRVKCRQGETLKFSGIFDLGSRSDTGQPIGTSSTVNASSTTKCGS